MAGAMVMGDVLALSGVYKSYRRGDRHLGVLIDLDLRVRTREIVAVIGGPHEGKTTLLQVAAGLLKPDKGEVSLAGVDLLRCSDKEHAEVLGREVAWVHCEEVRLDLKMLTYIALPLVVSGRCGKHEAEHLVMQALKRVGAEECAGQRWRDLTNWERVLVGFARGIVREPSLLVVDDVLNGLGMDRTREAGELLLSFLDDPGCSVLMSASDSEATLVAQRVWCFERGGLKLTYDEVPGDAEVIELHSNAHGQRDSRGYL
jgi:putative ABC transport system ATP-binding protein